MAGQFPGRSSPGGGQQNCRPDRGHTQPSDKCCYTHQVTD